MGLGNWFRSSTTSPSSSARLLGVDLDAGRARAVSIRMGQPRTALLDDPHEELPLAISLERRTPEVGRAGTNLLRRAGHLSCSNYLPLLGHPNLWKSGRFRLDANAALSLALERFRASIGPVESLALSLPTYLSQSQVSLFMRLAEQARLPVRGTVVTPLALAANLLDAVITSRHSGHLSLGPVNGDADAATPPWVIRIANTGSTRARVIDFTALFVDADSHAMSVSLVGFGSEEVRLLSFLSLPRLGIRVWKERLLDCLADRCVRICRRDPRDSADLEQALYDQIDDALERARYGQRVTMNVRSSSWYQDLVHQAEDFDHYCQGLARQAGDMVSELSEATTDLEPPQAVWLTDQAAKLPGLVRAVRRNTPVRTAVNLLDVDAVATATARLAGRWLSGSLPRVHLDTALPMIPSSTSSEDPHHLPEDTPELPVIENR